MKKYRLIITACLILQVWVIAPPAAGYQPPGPTSETIEVTGSHSGLVRNPAVWRIVADRLAQPADEWRPISGADAHVGVADPGG